MLNDGLVTRFGIDALFGMHNLPGLPVGPWPSARAYGAVQGTLDEVLFASQMYRCSASATWLKCSVTFPVSAFTRTSSRRSGRGRDGRAVVIE